MEPYDIKPSIIKFYVLLGEEATGKKCLNPDFWGVAIQYGGGKVPPELAQALRECLHDFPSAQGVHPAAKMLLWQGYDFPDLKPLLSGWDQLMFKWKAEGITLEKARELLKSAGFNHDISLEASNKLAKWIENPTDVLERYSGIHAVIASTLFGSRCVELSRNTDEDPPIAEMFLKLFNTAGFDDKITEIEQVWENDQYEQMIVHFLFQDQTYQFKSDVYEQNNADIIMINCDAFLTNLGYTERVFRLDIPLDYQEQIGWFVVAEPKSFTRLCNALHIPASRVQTDIQPTIQVSEDFKYPVPLPDIITGNAIITPDNLSRYKNIVEAERLEISGDCELPHLIKAKSIEIKHWSKEVILPKLSHIEENFRISVNSSVTAENLVSIGGNLSIFSADILNLPRLKSVGGNLQIYGRSPRHSLPTYLNAPELNEIKQSVEEGMVNVVLNTPKLIKIASSISCLPMNDHPELGRCYWKAEPPKSKQA